MYTQYTPVFDAWRFQNQYIGTPQCVHDIQNEKKTPEKTFYSEYIAHNAHPIKVKIWYGEGNVRYGIYKQNMEREMCRIYSNRANDSPSEYDPGGFTLDSLLNSRHSNNDESSLQGMKIGFE